jgi:hypothetical protein
MVKANVSKKVNDEFFDEMKLLESENGEDNDCAETF